MRDIRTNDQGLERFLDKVCREIVAEDDGCMVVREVREGTEGKGKCSCAGNCGREPGAGPEKA